MLLSKLTKFVVPGIAIIVTSLPVVYFLRKYLSSDEEYYEADIDEVLFFDLDGTYCSNHFKKQIEKNPCHLPDCSVYKMRRIVHYINNAERSLDVCLYLITLQDLGSAIINAHRRGVAVKVVTDEDMSNGSGSQVLSLRQNGIPVRHRFKSTMLMHHKFVIIDKKILMNGSLNWTMQAIGGNSDNLMITNRWQLVKPYLIEFDRLWNVMA